MPQIPSDMKSKMNSEKVLIVAAGEEEKEMVHLPGPQQDLLSPHPGRERTKTPERSLSAFDDQHHVSDLDPEELNIEIASNLR